MNTRTRADEMRRGSRSRYNNHTVALGIDGSRVDHVRVVDATGFDQVVQVDNSDVEEIEVSGVSGQASSLSPFIGKSRGYAPASLLAVSNGSLVGQVIFRDTHFEEHVHVEQKLIGGPSIVVAKPQTPVFYPEINFPARLKEKRGSSDPIMEGIRTLLSLGTNKIVDPICDNVEEFVGKWDAHNENTDSELLSVEEINTLLRRLQEAESKIALLQTQVQSYDALSQQPSAFEPTHSKTVGLQKYPQLDASYWQVEVPVAKASPSVDSQGFQQTWEQHGVSFEQLFGRKLEDSLPHEFEVRFAQANSL
jgi:hypothetical protein